MLTRKNKKLLKFFAAYSMVSVASAGTSPSLTISGGTIIDVSTNTQKKKKEKDEKAGRSPMISIGVSDVYFTAEGKTEKGLTYKWRMNVTSIPHVNPYIDRNYFEFGYNSLGTFQLGAVSGVEDTMSQTALNLIGGGKSIDGTFGGTYNFSSGIVGNVHPIGYTKRATKIVYVSPRIQGFQLGLAYTPNTSKLGRGEEQGIGHDSALYFKKIDDLFGQNNLAFGLSYKNTWDDLSLEIALTGVTERSRLKVNKQRVNLHNTFSYQIGSTVGYKDFSFCASYMDNKKSRLPKTAGQTIITGKLTSDDLMNGNAGKMWDVGAQYVHDAWQFGIAYFNSERKINATDKAKSKVIAATVDYKIFPGLKLFSEVDFVSTKTTASAVSLANRVKDDSGIGNNSGKLFLVGAKISF